MRHGPYSDDKQPDPVRPAAKPSRHSLRIAPVRGKVVPFPGRRGPSRHVPPPPPRRRFRLGWIWVGLVVVALLLPYIWHG